VHADAAGIKGTGWGGVRWGIADKWCRRILVAEKGPPLKTLKERRDEVLKKFEDGSNYVVCCNLQSYYYNTKLATQCFI
jgi:hypothetical protein